MGDPFNRNSVLSNRKIKWNGKLQKLFLFGFNFNYCEMELFLTQMDRFILNMEFSEYCHELYMYL